MMCDIVIAADNAKFGQPEINLGIMPGAGGTQRLPRAISKAKAMDLCLTARMMDAQEAERAGLVSRVVPLEKLMDEALAVAREDRRLFAAGGDDDQGIDQPRVRDSRSPRACCSSGACSMSQFALEDQKEGMAAFLEKRKPAFKTPINRTALILLAAHILSMLGFSTYAALLPELRDAWSLSNSQAGIVGGMFFAGYVARFRSPPRSPTASMRAGSTSRASLLAAAASARLRPCRLRLLERGAVPGAARVGHRGAPTCRACALLSDRISGPNQSRYIAFYTSFFGIGTALSFAIAGLSRRATAGARPFSSERARAAACRRSWWRLLLRGRRPRTASGASLGALFPLRGVAPGARRPCERRLHASATWRIVSSSSARARWMVAFLAFSASLHPAIVPVAAARDRGRGQSARGAGFDRRQRGRAAHRAVGAGSCW